MRPFQTMHLSRQSEPLYRELAERLRQELLAYRPGDYLPGEIQLAQRFAVNRHTLRRRSTNWCSRPRAAAPGQGTQVLEAPTIYPMGAANAYTESLSAQATGSRPGCWRRASVRPAPPRPPTWGSARAGGCWN